VEKRWQNVEISGRLAYMVEGPIATLLGAAAASAGLMRPVLVFIVAAADNLTADSIWYSLGRAGKPEWVLHFGRIEAHEAVTAYGREALRAGRVPVEKLLVSQKLSRELGEYSSPSPVA
jgi:hypothetical protein